jgi:hypothetical protein
MSPQNQRKGQHPKRSDDTHQVGPVWVAGLTFPFWSKEFPL